MDIGKIVNERYNPDEEYLGTEKTVNQIDPLVSVCVSTYQHRDYISDCIESIVSQITSFPYELLIGEDESEDGTRDICMQYAEKYPDKIRLFLRNRETSVLRDSDGNIISYLNMKFIRKACRGKFYAICEGDDHWIDNRKLEKQVEYMKQFPECNMSYHPVILHLFKSNTKKIANQHYEKLHIVSTEKIIQGGGAYCPTCSLMIRKEVFDHDISWIYNFPVGDYFLQILASLNGGALYINEVMGVYRKGVPGSWSERNESYIKKFNHTIRMCKSMQVVNERTNFRYKKEFNMRENLELFQALKNLYSYPEEQIIEIKSIIRKETDGKLLVKCYYNLVKSYMYYKLKMGMITKLLRKLNFR